MELDPATRAALAQWGLLAWVERVGLERAIERWPEVKMALEWKERKDTRDGTRHKP